MNRCYPLLMVILLACGDPYKKLSSRYSFSSAPGAPDYALIDNWAAHPYKHDAADSVPRPLRNNYRPDSTVDVFFIHPTTYIGSEHKSGPNAGMDDAYIAAKTDYSTILYQASIFNEAGRVFAPRYRQAHYEAYLPKTKEDTVQAIAAFELAYQDVKAAFVYYMAHENKGRPIIIAAHSQGTTHGKRLVKEFFDGKPMQQQLVAAYLVGMPLEPGYYTSIPPCLTPDQTGCTTSWRTFKQGYRPVYIQQEKFKAIVTNPLTWDASIPTADRSMNKGAVLLNFNSLIKRSANANIGEGVLWADKPRFFGNIFFTDKNYHIADMNLYYLSIRENAKLRVEAYRKKKVPPGGGTNMRTPN
jgi:hypothetical protein